MPDYGQKSKYTRAEIDVALGAAMRVSNPNLIRNGYFLDPINQRGQTEHTGDGYGIDGWCSIAGGNAYRVTKDGLYMMRTTAYAPIIRQLIPLDEGLKGKEVTISFVGSESSKNAIYMHLYIASGVNAGMTQICSARVNSAATATIPADETRPYLLVGFDLSDGNTATVRACKLEGGSVSTLANDLFPDKTLELLKCQSRLFRHNNTIAEGSTGNQILFDVNRISGTTLNCVLNLPVPLASRPAVSYKNLFLYDATANTFTELAGSNISYYWEKGSNLITLMIPTTGITFDSTHKYAVMVRPQGFFSLDAEL